MKLVLNDIYDYELKNYLLSQEGIINVEISVKDFISEINIRFSKKLTPILVVKYIELFQYGRSLRILSFDKGVTYKFNKLKYLVDDICCEYCYESLIYKLFQKSQIKSVKSNFNITKSPINIELLIEYNKDYNEEVLKKYIAENIFKK